MLSFLKKLLKNHLVAILLALLSIRMLMLGANIGDAIVLLSLSGLYGFMKFQEKKELDEAEEMKKDIKILKDAIQGLKIERAVRRSPNETNQGQGRIF